MPQCRLFTLLTFGGSWEKDMRATSLSGIVHSIEQIGRATVGILESIRHTEVDCLYHRGVRHVRLRQRAMLQDCAAVGPHRSAWLTNGCTCHCRRGRTQLTLGGCQRTEAPAEGGVMAMSWHWPLHTCGASFFCVRNPAQPIKKKFLQYVARPPEGRFQTRFKFNPPNLVRDRRSICKHISCEIGRTP